MSPPTPRLFIIRHGETEWSLNGRHTGVSDIPLTANGERRIRSTGRALVGEDRLIVPQNLAAIFVSPRQRARRTLELLVEEGLCHHADAAHAATAREPGSASGKDGLGARKVAEWLAAGKAEVRDDVREWDYGAYEGVRSAEIHAERAAAGLPAWDIWRDGCPDGESPAQIAARLDAVIAEIRRRFHAPALAAPAGAPPPPSDVLIVAHGHVLRALAGRWVGRDVADNPGFLLEAGGVGTLSYEHRALDEPAIMLGGAFVVDVVEEVEAEAGKGRSGAGA